MLSAFSTDHFYGKDVLLALPSLSGGENRIHEQPYALAVGTSGAALVDTDAATGRRRWDFTYHLSRATARAMETFYDGRHGRHGGFFFVVPVLAFRAVTNVTWDVGHEPYVTVTACGYETGLYPYDATAKYFLFKRGAYAIGKVTTVGHGNTTTEWLGNITNDYLNYPTHGDRYAVCNKQSEETGLTIYPLRYGRFAEDAMEVLWLAPDLVEVRAAFLELPEECP